MKSFSTFVTTLGCFAVFLVMALAAPALVLAGDPDDWSSGGSDTPTMTPVQLENPLRVDSLEDLLVALLNVFITLMIPVIVFFIIYSGFKYVTAQGNPGKIEEATTALMYAIIGGVLILGAVAIAQIIQSTVTAFQ